MRKAVFLDRDGVVSTSVERLISPDQFELENENVSTAIKKINDSMTFINLTITSIRHW